MIKKIFNKYLIRFLMILFWIIFIIGYSYYPLVYNLFDFSKNEKNINVYCWADMIDYDAIKEFENNTGIKVNLSYYEYNYELISKLELTKARDYDLVIATDFTISHLKKMGILQQIDHKKLDFWNNLEKGILNRSFDFDNKYTIPYIWDLYVIGYNKKYFSQGIPVKGWGLIFDPKYMPNRIGMLEEANEIFLVGAQYLYNSIDDLTDYKLESIKNLLLDQKKNVESYVDMRAGTLLSSGGAYAAVCQSAYICRQMKFNNNVDLFVPKEGSFVVIDSFVIPKGTKKSEYVYQFLNFIYKKENFQKVIEKYLYLPARVDLLTEFNSCLGDYNQISKYLKNASIYSSEIPLQKINELWMELKSY